MRKNENNTVIEKSGSNSRVTNLFDTAIGEANKKSAFTIIETVCHIKIENATDIILKIVFLFIR